MHEPMSLLFAFTDSSDSFVHGFEAGQLCARMEAREPDIDCGHENGLPLHTANLELVQRMAAAYRYEGENRATEYEEWTAVRLRLAARPRPKLAIV